MEKGYGTGYKPKYVKENMNICEDCIKQDVCKFKEEVEKYEEKAKLPEPLIPVVGCKYKETSYPYYYPDYWTDNTWSTDNLRTTITSDASITHISY